MLGAFVSDWLNNFVAEIIVKRKKYRTGRFIKGLHKDRKPRKI
jgi:hypothetical protein